MREWTREERYRVLHSADEIADLHDRNAKSVYRQTYHVQPITGLSSDPNGFVLFKGTWHLCYQWCPWGAVHGLKYWYHATSPDLIHWNNAGVGMWPDTEYDNKGCHSGSAITDGKELYFFYTGNHRDENWVRTPYTCAAIMDAEGALKKLPEPLFGPRPDYSEHQRDPKVFYIAEKERYYIFIGAQTQDGKGCVQVYQSKSSSPAGNSPGSSRSRATRTSAACGSARAFRTSPARTYCCSPRSTPNCRAAARARTTTSI